MITDNDRARLISRAKRAFSIADYSKHLIYRAMITFAKKSISFWYGKAESTHTYGHNLTFGREERMRTLTKEMNRGIDAIVSDLLDEVEAISKKTAKDVIAKIPNEKWDKDAFMAAILFGDTFTARKQKYGTKLKKEVEAYIAVGQEEGKSETDTILWFQDNIEAPHKDPLIDEAIGAGLVSLSGNSAFHSMAYLANDMVTRGFHKANSHYWYYAKAKYIIAQKDSHTCENCQDLDGKVFPINEDVLPVHGSCRCIEIPIL